MAYVLPSRVTMQLEKELKEGKEYEVTCSAEGVAPVNYLTISLTRGGEPFLHKSYSEDLDKGLQNRKTSFRFTAHRTDNLQHFACLATLNLANVTHTTVWSPPVTVRTYESIGSRGQREEPVTFTILTMLFSSFFYYFCK
ncbi:intercellular adhesion molecule 4 [Hyperolius riggenbachi]|uniref:intercellular adhesion molecule 4 n=1 Tax=Hyperolius riggenbachi TaxID=752182 RepID=UPI0035A35F6E